ncbi:MAG: DUF2336 domain-containing protein [Proteobacteria bacterium]|nr:DUF2336 domain-containing protein [Pseudomonadota bacterium]
MNVTISQRLPEMFSLARERSEESRVRLANILADVFLENSQLNEREQLLLNEIIDELIGNTTTQVRQLLAHRLAKAENVPHRVLLSLACDSEAAVAIPILKNALLKDDDLIYVVEAHGHDHALAVAERALISEAVVDALVATGDLDVMTTVAENLGAKISPRAMHVLIEAARFGNKLQEGLLLRPELTLDMGVQLYWWLESEMRRAMIKRFGIPSGQVEEALEQSINDLLTNVEADRNDSMAMLKVAEWFEARGAITSKVMIHCLRMGFFKLFDILLAKKTTLDIPMVETMVAEDGGRPLSVLCRAMDVDKPSFVSIFLLSRGARPGEQIVNPRELSQAISAYDRVDAPTARKIIDSWKKNPNFILDRLKQVLQ